MQSQKQFVVSLCKLSLPEISRVNKITFSALSAEEQLFIQNSRIVKNAKVNLFRECLFLPSHQNKLLFRIYSIDDSNRKSLLVELTVPQKDLLLIHKRPTTFRNSDLGYELIWDSWFFSEESEDLESCTDRNYSELNLPFQSEGFQLFPDNKMSCEKKTAVTSQNLSDSAQIKKLLDQVKQIRPILKESNEHFQGNKKDEKKSLQNIDKAVHVGEKNGRNKIKTQVCSELIKDITSLWFNQGSTQ